MKHFVTYLILLVGVCGCKYSSTTQLRKERDQLSAQLSESTQVIQSLRDTILMLSFPADKRLAKIKCQILSEDFSSATQGINQLIELFPETKEAELARALTETVNKSIARKKAEEERLKALGFKALKATSSIVIDYNKVDITNMCVGNTFVFDAYDDEYFYKQADRGNKFITASMRITSQSKQPCLPQLAIYSISGDTMTWMGSFQTRFARWEDYGAYLGNYPDYGNDFAKTSTVRFKIGKEVSAELANSPYALVLKKENALTRSVNRFNSPPVSYIGSVYYPETITIEDFTKDESRFVIISVANL